ncbi:glycoside hydrolase family 1 protein [bacterium]|nr:MAG: glycoside hydrolase family 1 protein [bacterium]
MAETKKRKHQTKLKFPDGFLWGAGTSAYQVEGGIERNDWAVNRKLKPAGLACDHYHKYREDFALAKKMHHNAHRLSLEWSRIEPMSGVFDDHEIAHYLEVLKCLRKNKIKTFVTLHHFTNPIWISKQGGWAGAKTVWYFRRYVSKVCQALGQYVDFWITINEPNVYVGTSYTVGVWPPFKKSLIQSYFVYRNMLKAHNEAYRIIHYFFPHAQVGFSQDLAYNEPVDKRRFLDRLVVVLADWFNVGFTYKRTKNDFIGLNHYFHNCLKFSFSKFVDRKTGKGDSTDKCWEIFPQAIYEVLLQLKKYDLPIYITENGIADKRDAKRARYIESYLREIHKAIGRGVDVRGYLYWSLLDNYEWPMSEKNTGYEMKFGLVEVDFKTLGRAARKSAGYFAAICKSNKL